MTRRWERLHRQVGRVCPQRAVLCLEPSDGALRTDAPYLRQLLFMA